MTLWTVAPRLTILTDASLQASLISILGRADVHCYNISKVTGRGQHRSSRDPITGDSLIRVEVVLASEKLNDIAEELHKRFALQYPFALFRDEVFIDDRDQVL